MRVVMVSAHYQLLDGRIFHREARSIAQAGHEVVLVRWDRERDGDIVRKTIDGVETVDIPVDIQTSLPLIWKAARFRTIRKRIAKAVVDEKPDVIHCHDLDTLPIGVDAKRDSGAPLVYDAHEDYGAMVAQKSRLTGRAMAAYESRMLRHVDHVVTVNDILARRYRESIPTTVVANYPDLAKLEVPKADIRRKHGLEGKTIVVYAGGISRHRGILELLDAVASDRVPPSVHALIFGRPLDDLKPTAEAERRGIADRVTTLGAVPFGEVQGIVSASDIGFVVLEPTASNHQATPVKMFEYMAAGIPSIVNRDFPIPSDVLRKWGCGVGADYDGSSVATSIMSLQDSAERSAMGRRGRDAIRQEYNWESQVAALLNVYRLWA